MNIIGEYDVRNRLSTGEVIGDLIFTVELEEDIVVDVKVCVETGYIYTMENCGDVAATVYNCLTEERYPDYEYDEEAVIEMVRKAYEEKYVEGEE